MWFPGNGRPLLKKKEFHFITHFLSLSLSPFGLNLIHAVSRIWEAPFKKIAF
jgi:hypothetical protein